VWQRYKEKTEMPKGLVFNLRVNRLYVKML